MTNLALLETALFSIMNKFEFTDKKKVQKIIKLRDSANKEGGLVKKWNNLMSSDDITPWEINKLLLEFLGISELDWNIKMNNI